MGEVIAYVKNHHLSFAIPYTLDSQEHTYTPDYVVRIRLPSPASKGGSEDMLNLILEVTGEKKKDKAAKVAAARTLWVPAVNNHGGLGRWAFLEITDPWDAKNTIRVAMRGV